MQGGLRNEMKSRCVNQSKRVASVRLFPSGDKNMKFVKLNSRGGDYLVVVDNIAWLRADENGQTKVGIVGGPSLLVVGSVEEVAAMVLAG
jgi:hypothetical protein